MDRSIDDMDSEEKVERDSVEDLVISGLASGRRESVGVEGESVEEEAESGYGRIAVLMGSKKHQWVLFVLVLRASLFTTHLLDLR